MIQKLPLIVKYLYFFQTYLTEKRKKNYNLYLPSTVGSIRVKKTRNGFWREVLNPLVKIWFIGWEWICLGIGASLLYVTTDFFYLGICFMCLGRSLLFIQKYVLCLVLSFISLHNIFMISFVLIKAGVSLYEFQVL